MTDQEIEMALALGGCSFQPGSWAKRFARNLAFKAENAPTKGEFTDKQRYWLYKLSYMYRRQMPARLVRAAQLWLASGDAEKALQSTPKSAAAPIPKGATDQQKDLL